MTARTRRPRALSRGLRSLLLGTLVLVAVGTPADAAKKRDPKSPDDLLIVDCLLRPQIRRIGSHASYMAPRLPVRTTAIDCRIRGGEYTEPDQASYATALRVWLPEARGGDAEAQYFVGQIYERGLGTEPDFAAAVEWYQQSAERDFAPAMVNLGYLYEAGLGVERDKERALSLYRRAAGGNGDLVVMQEEELSRLRGELDQRTAEVESLQARVTELGHRVEELEAEVQRGDQSHADELARLRDQLKKEKERLTATQLKVVELEANREPKGIVSSEIDFGRYFALVIGNRAYQFLDPIETARDDAERVATTLERLYGYETDVVLDATRFDIMQALNRTRARLKEDDNLLIYYAGHSLRDAERNTAYWQPVDAKGDDPANWIPSGVLADHLDLMSAKHVLVVADSAFSGMRTRSSVAKLPTGQSDERRAHVIRRLLDRRARLILASGDVDPVEETEARFVDAFLDVLESNEEILEASELYLDMNDMLAEQQAHQRPEFATLRWTRNDVADFFFVRQD